MKKTMLFISSLMLISTISYGAFHKPGASLFLNTTESPRFKSTSGNGATGNVNTLFYVMADAYTSYHVPNPTGYGDEYSESRIYWPQLSGQYIVKSIKSKTGQQSDGSYDYDIQAFDFYEGWISHYYYSVSIATPPGYSASANAYIQWTD